MLMAQPAGRPLYTLSHTHTHTRAFDGASVARAHGKEGEAVGRQASSGCRGDPVLCVRLIYHPLIDFRMCSCSSLFEVVFCRL